MPRLPAKDLLSGLQRTLSQQGVDYERIILEFGQVAASEVRERGHSFSLSKHVRGLILSQLGNQRPWGPIAASLPQLQEIFLDYDPDALEAADSLKLTHAVVAIRCGNRQISRQMTVLADNIRLFRKIESDTGSLDEFIVSADPDTIANRLARAGPLKLKQVGYTLAMEYLRNVGIRAPKPDVHVRRVLSGDRLGYIDHHPSEKKAYRIVCDLAAEAGCNPTYLDNLLWLFCAQDYGNICRADPRCDVCEFRDVCNFARESKESTTAVVPVGD